MSEAKKGESDLRALLCVLGSELDYIHDNTKDFMAKFAIEGYCELIDVYFSDTKIKIHYVMDCGQHVSDEKDIAEYLKWRDT